MARVRHRGRRIAVGLAVLVLAAGGLLVACTPMARAAPGAVADVERVVGDNGTVTAFTVDRRINVTPSCSITVRLREGVSQDETARILEEAWAATGESPCIVTTIALATRSSIGGMPVARMDADAAAAASAALHRFDGVTLLDGDRGLVASVAEHSGDFSTAAALVRAAVESQDLEEAFGSVRWSLRWSAEDGPFDDVEITSDATPDPALAAVLDGLAGLRADGTLGEPIVGGVAAPVLEAPISGVSVRAASEAGAVTIGVHLTAAGWSAADVDAQHDAFVSSSRAAAVAEAVAAIVAEAGAPPATVTANGLQLAAVP